MSAVQQAVPFPSVDFPNRTSITAHEIARKLRVTVEHTKNLIRSGELVAEPRAAPRAKRHVPRVSLENYRRFIASRTILAAGFFIVEKVPWPFPDAPINAPMAPGDLCRHFAYTPTHFRHLINGRVLSAVDLRGRLDSDRSRFRIPVEGYRHWIVSSIVKPRN